MPPLTAIAATPMSFVAAIVWAYGQRGKSPAAALSKAQIEPSQVQQPQARITAWQMEAISEAAMRELDDEALGWFARRLPWGSYGMLARASMGAPTLGVALKRWCRHHGLLSEDVRLALVYHQKSELLAQEIQASNANFIENRVSIRITESPFRQASLPPAVREFCLVSMLRNIHGLACWAVDSRIPLHGAQFPFAAPAHAHSYAVLFDGPTLFEAPDASIGFDAAYLNLALRRDESALNAMLQHALPLTVRQYRRDRLLVQRVRDSLTQDPALNAHTLAHALHLSPRTLHRQLKDEGASLQALKDEVRHQRATELLLRTQRPIKQIAQAAGFQNEKSFIRTFKSWTGLPPAVYRKTPPMPHS